MDKEQFIWVILIIMWIAEIGVSFCTDRTIEPHIWRHLVMATNSFSVLEVDGKHTYWKRRLKYHAEVWDNSTSYESQVVQCHFHTQIQIYE